MLWNSSLVMKDIETESLWSHLLGKAMAGPLEGKTLKRLPAVITDWATWKKKHPATTVASLKPTTRGFRRQMYQQPAAFLVGLVAGDASRAWKFDQLIKQPVVNDRVDTMAVLLVFDKASGTPWIYDRKVAGQILDFYVPSPEAGSPLIDQQTHSTWDRLHMRAVDGPLAGEQLRPLPGIVSFTRAWKAFYPWSTYFEANDEPAVRPAASGGH